MDDPILQQRLPEDDCLVAIGNLLCGADQPQDKGITRKALEVGLEQEFVVCDECVCSLGKAVQVFPLFKQKLPSVASNAVNSLCVRGRGRGEGGEGGRV